MPIIGANHTFNTGTSELRIVSLVPSITELLCHLGLRKNIIACTKFCEHPIDLKSVVQQIGGTKNPRTEEIIALNPDVVFTNKEENRKDDVLHLSQYINVHVSDINTISDFKAFVTDLGKLFAIEEKTSAFNFKLSQLFTNLSTGFQQKAVYLIWKSPYMAAGKNTYIDSVLTHCGYINAVDHSRYPEITIEEIQQLKPDCVFLSSEPYPFKKKDLLELQKSTGLEIKIVDGELFSWYSNRIFHIESHLKALRNH